MYKPSSLALAVGLAVASYSGAALSQQSEPTEGQQSEQAALKAQLSLLQQQLNVLQARLAELEQQKQPQQQQVASSGNDSANNQTQSSDNTTTSVAANRQRSLDQSDSGVQARLEQLETDVEKAQNWPIRVGGAVRFQYSYEDYNEGNQDRGGDLDFDIFRLDLDGEIGDVILSAQYRWFQYQDVLHHAWVGYNFTPEWQGQLGITKVPFGIMPYNSHSYFFNSTFYVGLEDEYDAGAKMIYRGDQWDFDIAFFKSDEQGGADGSSSDRTHSYSYDPIGIRLPGEGPYDDVTQPIGEGNSWALRGARTITFGDEHDLELGLSGQYGNLYSADENLGNRKAWAGHAVYTNGPWEVMLQYADYQYDIDMENRGIVVGAYAYADTIASEAKIYTANLAYSMPVEWGPITNVTFYNDHSQIVDKRGYREDTWMNVLGMAVSSGGLYT